MRTWKLPEGRDRGQVSFIFEVMDELDEGALVVLVGRQGRGCSLVITYALSKPFRGAWQLSWKELTGKCLATRSSSPRPTATDDYCRLALIRRAAQGVDVLLGSAVNQREI